MVGIYYDKISGSYNELHGEEQKKKFEIVCSELLRYYTKEKIKNMKILDIGAGTGIASFGNSVLLDPSESLLKIAEKNDKKNGIKRKKIVGCAENLPFGGSSFDLIISLSALHHTDIKKAVEEIKRVVRIKKNENDEKPAIVLSIFKRAENFKEIKKEIKKNLNIMKEIDAGLDTIYFCFC